MAYRHLLKNIKFDYSYNSLIEIDKVLKLIKTNERLTHNDYDKFVNDTSRQQFIYFLGCYIASTSAHLAKTTQKWFNYEEMKDIMNRPDFVFCLEHNQLVMFDNNSVKMPLMAVTNYFFDMNPNSSLGAKNYADNVIRDNTSNLQSFGISVISNKQIPPYWRIASASLAVLIEPILQAISIGLSTQPTSLDLDIENNTFIHTLPSFHSEEDMKNYLNIPFGNSNCNFLCYESYVNLPTGRTDGLVMEARVFNQPTLKLEFILPYRPANHPFGLAFYPLITSRTEGCDEEALKVMAQIVYEGIATINLKAYDKSFKDFYIDKHDLFAVAPWVTQPINLFNPIDSQIEILPLPA